jgi:hypothetical protein
MILVVHLEQQISPRIFEKNLKLSLWNTQGLGGRPEVEKKSRGNLPLMSRKYASSLEKEDFSFTLIKKSLD